MLDDWFSTIELPLTWQQFWQLPQNPAYKYEYFDGQAWLTPRPKNYDAVLDVQTFARPAGRMVTRDKLVIRPLEDADWPRLPKLFAASLHRVQPFASLTNENRLKAAEGCLAYTRSAGDGPLVGEACLVAARDDLPVGAILITLPDHHSIEAAIGQPHVTWVFVAPLLARRGVGTALLDAAVQALLRLGHVNLFSTFLIGNESSMLWHWQAGFKLLEQPWSLRATRREVGE